MITQSIETITPELATQILEKRMNNRPIQKANSLIYSRVMAAGRWQLGPPLMFNGQEGWAGLIDGQHRMDAVRIAGVPVQFIVIRGLPTDTFKHVDVGKGRSAYDMLAIMGVKYASIVAAISRCAGHVEIGGEPWHPKTFAMPGEVADRAAEDTLMHEVAKDICDKYISARALLKSAGFAGWMLYSIRRAKTHAAKGDKFFATLNGNEPGSDATDPAFVLRNRLIEDSLAKTRMSRKERCALAIKAWNAYAVGKPVQRLKFNVRGKTAENFPELVF